MRSYRALALLFAVAFGFPAGAQALANTPQAATLLQQSLTALSGDASARDVSLSGSVRRIVGPDDDTGSITLKAYSDNDSFMSVALPSGTISETHGTGPNEAPGIQSVGTDGVVHTGSLANTLWPAAWFSPALLLARAAAPGSQASYEGQESLDGSQVIHVSVVASSTLLSNAANAPPAVQAALTHMSEFDLYFDPATSLLAAVKFAIHPDTTAAIDIPVEVDFSDYRSVNGIQTPFHIQKSANGVLQLDITITSAIVNSGLQPADFAVD